MGHVGEKSTGRHRVCTPPLSHQMHSPQRSPVHRLTLNKQARQAERPLQGPSYTRVSREKAASLTCNQTAHICDCKQAGPAEM